MSQPRNKRASIGTRRSSLSYIHRIHVFGWFGSNWNDQPKTLLEHRTDTEQIWMYQIDAAGADMLIWTKYLPSAKQLNNIFFIDVPRASVTRSIHRGVLSHKRFFWRCSIFLHICRLSRSIGLLGPSSRTPTRASNTRKTLSRLIYYFSVLSFRRNINQPFFTILYRIHLFPITLFHCTVWKKLNFNESHCSIRSGFLEFLFLFLFFICRVFAEFCVHAILHVMHIVVLPVIIVSLLLFTFFAMLRNTHSSINMAKHSGTILRSHTLRFCSALSTHERRAH